MARRAVARIVGLGLILLLARTAVAGAQDPTSREAAIEQEQETKAGELKPARVGKAEEVITGLWEGFLAGQGLHTFWQSANPGGGFTLGGGYLQYVGPYSTLDLRGSISVLGYERVEGEFIAPELFGRRGRLAALGGWRQAPQVGFYGFGMTSTTQNRTNYSFEQTYVGAVLEVFPTRRLFLVRGGLELSQWMQNPSHADDNVPSVDEVYTPETLPGLGAHPVYWHTQGTVGFDSRAPSRGYARRGGYYGVTVHDFADPSGTHGFNRVDYEGIQHIPILRETWVVSLHAMAQTTYGKSGQTIPFFMMPSVGGGSDLRAYPSWRLRDLNSLYLQAEWRVMVNRFMDMAVLYDAGKVAARRADLGLNGMKDDMGVGFRWHGPAATQLRIDVTRGSEGLGFVFAASEVF